MNREDTLERIQLQILWDRLLAVVEEQAGVEVIVQVDQQAGAALSHAQKLSPAGLLPVLFGAALSPPLLVDDGAGREAQGHRSYVGVPAFWPARTK